MVSMKVSYKGQYRCEAEYLRSGEVMCTDLPDDLDGIDHYPAPVHYLALALATCVLTTMAKNLDKHGSSLDWCYAEIGDFKEDVKLIMITELSITFHLKAEYDSKTRKRLEDFAYKGCFIGNTLKCHKNFTFVYE